MIADMTPLYLCNSDTCMTISLTLTYFLSVVHCVGHGINLYHISTQASSDLNCIFREYFRAYVFLILIIYNVKIDVDIYFSIFPR